MSLFGNFFKKRNSKKKEIHADQQFLDAIEVLKETSNIYLDLLATARQNDDEESCMRLEEKLNSNFEYLCKSWDGEVRIIHTISSICSINTGSKRLKIE